MEKNSSAREHIEKIRRATFYIGRDEKNPLAAMVHRTVGYLSEELYSKDVHFLLELIQNAEDNDYPREVAPSLEFMITSKDIAETGAASTLVIFNNEKGFSQANIESICGAGISTKKGNRHRGYIGEKGIGFKSVFLISSQPHIFSNGYQIRFNEKPCEECNIGYIVPEWVTDGSMLSKVKELYGVSKPLPTTTLILPLKSDKIIAVKEQLSKMHPEILLFLSKIKQLSVKENNDNSALNTVSQVSISSETEAQTQKNINARSYTRHLASLENSEDGEDSCSYFMWVQKFPVKPECRVEKRMEVDEWTITLAFPWNQRLNRGQKMPGIYAFLPTEMETNFPFIIQADFLLNSSRESIQFDSMWNKGILECVPIAFIEAFKSLVKSVESAPSFNIPSMFRFLPINNSKFESVRQSIKEKIANEEIVPCEQNFFCKPSDVFRLFSDFWDILDKARKIGVKLESLSTHEAYILSSSFDKGKYDEVLKFMDVKFVDKQWYGKCIESSKLVKEVSDEVYMDLLAFLADHWYKFFDGSNVIHIPILKYVDVNGNSSWLSIYKAKQQSCNVCIATDEGSITWLINWNSEFRLCNLIFMPQRTQVALKTHSKKSKIVTWLKDVAKMEVLSVYDYASLVLKRMGSDRQPVVAFAHFIYHSSKNYLTEWQVKELCTAMPLVDNYGQVKAQWSKILVPAKGSKWVGLMVTNPWRDEGYVELGTEYILSGCFAGNNTTENSLLKFLISHIDASDVPEIDPPNASFPTVSSPLSKANTILLLEWIHKLRYRGKQIPRRFLDCVENGSWLKTSVGYKSPSGSFFPSSNWGSLLQAESVLVDIPIINQGFYGNKLGNYKDELKLIGVRFEFGEASTYIGNHLMATAASHNLTRTNVFSILKLIRVLRERHLPPEEFISSIKGGNWLKTTHGYRCPAGSVLRNSEWTMASAISNLPFVDTSFYDTEISNYSTELSLLGVLTSFNGNYPLLIDHFKLTSPVSADAALLILECITKVDQCSEFISKLKGLRWIKTHLGYKLPIESFLVDSEWECLLEVVSEVPLIDQRFYQGRLGYYKEALNKVGVLVRFQDASEAIVNRFKHLLSSNSLTKKNIIALLSCYRRLEKIHYILPVNLSNCMHSEKWVSTRTGLKCPSGSILYDQQWEAISEIASVPFIDDSDIGYGKEIHEYKTELKALGATVEFKDGAHFVIAGIDIPKDPSLVKPSSLIALLKCLKNLIEVDLDKFRKNVNKRWVKTSMGYMYPSECILFDSEFGAFLQSDDGPFINGDFYGSEFASFKEELKKIGVVVNCGIEACSLIASHLRTHNESATITRIYSFLFKYKWKPEDPSSDWIWIPNGDDGKWVGPKECVLTDKDNLFGHRLHVLDKLYEQTLLPFFSMVLSVRNAPSVRDYCELWNIWESSNGQQLTVAECSLFWIFIAKSWKLKLKTEKLLMDTVTMLPVEKGTTISLTKKQDVFIPDDLLLKDLLDSASDESIFIWYPSASSISRSAMNTIYSSIGAQKISQSATKESFSLPQSTNFIKLDSKETVIKTGLIKVILAFLANPSLSISVETRQLIVKTLLDSTIFETNEPLTMRYSLTLSSGKTLTVDACKLIRWERDVSSLFVQKVDKSSAMKTNIEFATYFSEALSEGLLYEKGDLIDALMEMIKIGCLMNYDEDGVDFLLKSKNLQLFEEDEKFLISAFSTLKV